MICNKCNNKMKELFSSLYCDCEDVVLSPPKEAGYVYAPYVPIFISEAIYNDFAKGDIK